MMIDFQFNFLYDFNKYIKDSLSDNMTAKVKDFSIVFWINFSAVCVVIVLIGVFTWVYFYRFLKETQLNEKMISVIPKASFYTNIYLMKSISEFFR